MVTFLFFERFSCRTNNPSLLRDKGGLLSNKAGLLPDEGGGLLTRLGGDSRFILINHKIIP